MIAGEDDGALGPPTHLELAAELVELLEDGHGLVLHLGRLQVAELAHLPAAPVALPVLRQLPDRLDRLQVLPPSTKVMFSIRIS